MISARFETFAAWVWDASWHGAVVVLVVLVVRQLGGRRLLPGLRCGLWLLVAARLLLIWAPQGSWSVFGLVEKFKVAEATPSALPISPQPIKESSDLKITVAYGPLTLESNPGFVPKPAAKSGGWDIAPFAILVWVAGALVLLARAAIACRRLNRRLGQASMIDDPQLLALLERCHGEMNVRRPVRLCSTDAVAGPALAGVWRPMILLPPGLCARLAPEELRFVFLHELAHVRRHDRPAHSLGRRGAHLYRADRELCRDEMVLRAVGPQHRQTYGHTLLSLLEMLPSNQASRPFAVAMLGGKHRLKQRISMIAHLRPTPARITVVVLLVAFSLIAWVVLTNPKKVASTAPSNPPASDRSTDRPDNQAVQAQLDRRLPELNFSGQGLADVIDFLRDVSGSNIVVNWRALETVGITKDAPVTARMKDIRLSKALNTILADVSGGNVRLSYGVEGGVITISTYDELNSIVTRVYDIRDMLVQIPDFDSDKGHPVGFRSGATRPVAEPPMPLSARAAAIIKLVRETIDPVSWNKPSRGSIQELNGQLIIAQTQENHRGIIQLFQQLRETRSIQILTTTHFVVFDPSVLPQDDPDWAAVRSLNQTASAGGTTKPKAILNVPCLTAGQTAALLSIIEKQKDAAIRSAPRLTTFNGQRAYVLVQTQRAYVADLKIIRDEHGKTMSYEPVVDVASSGLTVDIQTTASADRKYITMSIRPKMAKLLKMHTLPFSRIPADHPAGLEKPTVQQPEMLATEVRMTASVPDGQTLIVDSGEDAGQLTPDETAFKPKPGNRMFILVTPHLILGATPSTAPTTVGKLLD